RRQQTEPRRRERLAIDLRLDLTAFGKPRAEERQAFDARDPASARDVLWQTAVVADGALLIDREIPGNPPQLIVDVELQRVARCDVDRGEQRADEKRDQAEGQHRSPAEDAQQAADHRVLAAMRRARRACEGAEWGDGGPATTRAGVRGGAP